MKKKLGELLIEKKIISQERLSKLLVIQQVLRQKGSNPEKTRLGQFLIKQNLLTPQALQELLEEQASLELTKEETEADGLFQEMENFSKRETEQSLPNASTLTVISSGKSNQKSKEEQKAFAWKAFEIKESERYESVKILGEGGMGIVELVQDRLLEREVARKTIKVKPSTQKQWSAKEEILFWRFKQEATITAFLEHPNIIPLYEMQRLDQGEIRFTMRKVEGETLRSLLQKIREQEIAHDENFLINIFRKICDAIAYAHSKGVVHRDLKPENVMVGAFGEVYVMDWGIAKRLKESHSEADISLLEKKRRSSEKDSQEFQEEYKTIGGMGTPGYMPPEQAEDASQVQPQSDVYALGKILRECFTLQSPVEELRAEINRNTQKMKALDRSKKQNNPTHQTLPPEIEAIEKKATQTLLEDRYPTVQTLIADLERYQKNLKVSAKEYTLMEMLLKWLKRHRQKLLSGALVLSLILGIAAYFQWKETQKKEEEFKLELHNAREKKTSALQIQETNKQALGKKLKYLLHSLNSMNQALLIKPQQEALEKEKFEIGKELITICCQTKDYQLAEFGLLEMQKLSWIPEEQKMQLMQQIQESQNERVKKYLQRLSEIEKNFKSKIREEGDIEDSLFEIVKMQEEPILNRLFELLQEGNQYILKNKARDPKLMEFYWLIIETLGRFDQPSSETVVFKALEEISQKKILLYPEKQLIPEDETRYMVELAHALKNTKAVEVAKSLDELRYQMQNRNGSFFSQTESISRKLLEFTIEGYSQTILVDPKNPIVYKRRGLAKYKKEDWPGAIQDFNEAIRLNPNDEQAYINRANTKVNQGDLDGAIADFSEIIRRYPEYVTPYNNRGFVKMQRGDLDGAIADYTEAIRLDPEYVLAYHSRGDAKQNKNDLDGAIADYTIAIRLRPQKKDSYIGRGFAKYRKKDLDEALKDYEEAIRLDPQAYGAYCGRGVIHQEKDLFDKAIEDFNEAIRLNPQDSTIYLNRGGTKCRQGDWPGAIEDYSEAIRLDSQNPLIYYNRGLIYEQIKDLKKAKLDFQQFLKLAKQNPNPQRKLIQQQILQKFPELATEKKD